MTNASQDFSDRSKMKPNVFAFLNIVLGEAQDIKRTPGNTAFTDVINIHADGGVTARPGMLFTYDFHNLDLLS